MAVTITSKITDNTLVISPCGRIDSACAADTEVEFKKICNESTFTDVVLDAEKIEYISSAGLRIVLRMRKDYPTFKVINVEPEIYEIFEMTGFTEMMDIVKAYRVVSIDGCEIIGEGANGMVYRLDPDTIIKVYRNPDCLPDIQRERELARKAFVAGVPTAIPYDVVRVGDSFGSVFELLNSKSFAKLISANPSDADKYTTMSVELLKKIHATEMKPEGLPDMKQTVVSWVSFLKDYLPSDTFEKLKGLVAAVPESNNMIHGDYHIKNIMLQGEEALLIDMDTIARGDPIFEFASIYNAYIGFAVKDKDMTKKFLGIDYDTACRIWLNTVKEYFNTNDEKVIETVENKSALIGYVRLMRRSIRRNMLDTAEGKELIEFFKDEIIRLTSILDTVTF